MSNREDLGKLVLRVALGVVLLFHGVSKLTHGLGFVDRMLTEHGLPLILGYGTYVAEVVAPVLVILGWKARLAALVIAFDLVMAIALALRPMLFTIKGGGGWGVELEAMLLLTALAVFLLGSGRYRLGRGTWD
jgi:putative oxidoreductase